MNENSSVPVVLAPVAPRKRSIYDLSSAKLEETIAGWGQPSYRANQVLRWLYKELVTDFSQMTNLPLELRRKLAENFKVGSFELAAQKISADGWTRKVLLKMPDGNTIEAVLMLYYDRATVCLSSQVGCAMGCTFCATGQMGFTRNLSAGEILEQVLWFNRWLREHPHTPKVVSQEKPRYEGRQGIQGRQGGQGGQGAQGRQGRYDRRPPHRRTVAAPQPFRAKALDDSAWHVPDGPTPPGPPREITSVTNIVFMGMGEPLVNYANVWTAAHTLCSPQGLGMSPRRLTVSTVGIAPQIVRFAREDLAVNLAVSLHAPNDELRSSMMPMNTRYPLSELLAACRQYASITHRRITFEYVLINGTNDSLEAAHELAGLLKGLLCHVNLIPLNPVPGTGMKATPREQVFAFQKVIEDAGIAATVRIERGVDIAAACGQLKVEEEPNSRRRSLNPELVQAHSMADLAAHPV